MMTLMTLVDDASEKVLEKVLQKVLQKVLKNGVADDADDADDANDADDASRSAHAGEEPRELVWGSVLDHH